MTDVIGKHMTLEGYTELQKAVGRMGDNRFAGNVIRRAWRHDAREHLQPEVRGHVRVKLGGQGKLAKSYRAVVEGNTLNNTSMLVYSRVDATIPHELGPKAPIKPKNKKYLAIPTDFAQRKKRERTGA